MNKTIIPAIAFMILLALQAAAIGITPAITNVEYTPDGSGTVQFTIVNTEDRDITASITSGGEITLEPSKDKVHLGPYESEELSYTYTFPEYLDEGTKTGGIIVTETPDKTEGQIQIIATTAVVTMLKTQVPYQGKRIETEVALEPAPESKVDFTISVTNLGTEKIDDLKADIKILGEVIQTEPQELEPQRRTELKTTWTAPTEGEYEAEITIHYDDLTKTLTRKFLAGSGQVLYYEDLEGETAKTKSGLWLITLWISLATVVLINVYLYIKRKRNRFYRPKRRH